MGYEQYLEYKEYKSEEELKRDLNDTVALNLVTDYYDYINDHPNATDEEIVKYLAVNTKENVKKWCADNSEDLLVLKFGKEKVKNSRIDVSCIKDSKELTDKVVKYVETGIDIKSYVDSLKAYNEADVQHNSRLQMQLTQEITKNMLTASNDFVKNVPIIGDVLSEVIKSSEVAFDKGFDIVTGHVAQLQYIDIMCDYYTNGLTAEQLKQRISQIYNLTAKEKKELEDLLRVQTWTEMQEELEKELGKNPGASARSSYWLEKGNELYSKMTEEERKEYGIEWRGDLSDDIKNGLGGDYDDAGNAAAPRDPLIIDLGKKGIELTNVQDGVHFDLDNNNFAEKTAWIGTEDGFLALDRNGNGQIDNGGELFGDQVKLKDGSISKSGFDALADLDDNEDGVIDINDSKFKDLRVWVDANHNGKSEADELKTLDEFGIESISLEHSSSSKVDEITGTIVSETSTVMFKDGRTGDIGEHWFQVNAQDTEDKNHFDVDIDVSSVNSFGNVMSLNNAIKADKTGKLLELVNEFKKSTDYVDKRVMVKKILYFITGSNDISSNSRGGNIDARDLHVIEMFMGQEFKGLDGTSPNVNAANILKNLYNKLENMYFNLLNEETEVGNYLDLVLKRWNEKGSYLDLTDFESAITAMIGKKINVENSVSGVASWIKQYDETYGTNYFSRIRQVYPDYSKLLDRVQSTNVIIGGDGNDSLSGTSGSDAISGGSGNDSIYGGSGNDVLYGDGGNDYLDGGAGDDIIKDNSGDDTYVFAKGYGNDVIYDEGGHNTLKFTGLNPKDILVNGTGEYDVTIRIKGTNDTLVIKNFRKDATHADYLLQFENKTMKVTDKDSPFRHIYGTGEDEVLKAVVKDSYIHAYDGDDMILGSEGNDIIYGGNGNDIVYAEDGADKLFGGSGNDELHGEKGKDIIYGDAGNDIIDGGEDDDMLYGGAGNDTYIFGKKYGTDIISDNDGVSTIKLIDGVSLKDIDVVLNGNEAIIFINGEKDTKNKLIIENYKKNEDKYVLEVGNEKTTIKNYIANDKKIHAVLDDLNMIFGTESSNAIFTKDELNMISGGSDYDYIIGGAKEDLVFGGDDIDRILTKEGDDVIYGGKGNDQLFGEAGDDFVNGGAGDDYINTGVGNDTINGGTGNDYMTGGAGDDVYFFNKGDGNDKIADIEGMNTIIFGDGISANDIKAYRSNWNDIILKINGTDDSLVIKNYCINEDARNFNLVFADGTVIDAVDPESPLRKMYGSFDSNYESSIYEDGITIIGRTGDDQLVGSNGSDFIYGEEGNDRITGGAGDDVIYGGTGNDYLNGGTGNDTYVYNIGDGIDTISDSEGINNINIEGYSANQVKAYRTNWNDITLEFEGSDGKDKIVIEGFYNSESNRNFYISFNGNRVHATAGNSPLRTVYGTDISDYMVALDDYGTTLIGGKGDDTLNGEAGSDYLYGGEGDDRILGGAGDDLIYGGTGNDYLSGDKGNDTYIWGIGDGTDTISDNDGINTIEFIGGVKPEDITAYRYNWNDLMITVNGSEDKLIIQNYFADKNSRNFKVKFENGKTYNYADIDNPINNVHANEYDDWMYAWSDDGIILYGDCGNDNLFGGSGNDILVGGIGNDTLKGGEGDDTYIYSLSDGSDVIEDTVGENTLKFKDINLDQIEFVSNESVNKLEINIKESGERMVINNYKEENFKFEFENGVSGSVSKEGVFAEKVVEDDVDTSVCTLKSQYNSFDNMASVQVLKLTEEMSAFGNSEFMGITEKLEITKDDLRQNDVMLSSSILN